MAPLNPLLPDGITLTDWLASITDSHDPATIGTKTIDETGLSDGYTLIYDSASGTWKCQSGGGGGPHGSTHTNGTDNVAVSDGIQISGCEFRKFWQVGFRKFWQSRKGEGVADATCQSVRSCRESGHLPLPPERRAVWAEVGSMSS